MRPKSSFQYKTIQPNTRSSLTTKNMIFKHAYLLKQQNWYTDFLISIEENENNFILLLFLFLHQEKKLVIFD